MEIYLRLSQFDIQQRKAKVFLLVSQAFPQIYCHFLSAFFWFFFLFFCGRSISLNETVKSIPIAGTVRRQMERKKSRNKEIHSSVKTKREECFSSAPTDWRKAYDSCRIFRDSNTHLASRCRDLRFVRNDLYEQTSEISLKSAAERNIAVLTWISPTSIRPIEEQQKSFPAKREF